MKPAFFLNCARPATALLGMAVALFSSEAVAQSPLPSQEDPRIHELVAAASAVRIEHDIRTLVGFGTRHTLSDTLGTTRGIGAARRWVFAQFQEISRQCGNTRHTLQNVIIDNYFFGVAAVGRNGQESLVAFPR